MYELIDALQYVKLKEDAKNKFGKLLDDVVDNSDDNSTKEHLLILSLSKNETKYASDTIEFVSKLKTYFGNEKIIN